MNNMLIEEMQHILPADWTPMDVDKEKYKIVTVHPLSQECRDVEFRILGNYYSRISGIYRLQSPYLYSKFTLKAHEYAQRGPYDVLSLFHDTPRENVESIAAYNFDWRFGRRFKYGPGVYFSISPTLANRHSFRGRSNSRTMFIADVLVQKVQEVDGPIFLPDYGYDTVLAHNKETYVKYFDCEYYPRYLVDYHCNVCF